MRAMLQAQPARQTQPQQPGLVSILGSGELSDTMAETHRSLMARLHGPVLPVFLDTPAGFELNVDLIDQKAIDYFHRNFELDLAVARYRSTNDNPETIASAVRAIQEANYIFAGPGSPSYAVRTWQDSLVWKAVITRWREGAALVFSSAASVVLGKMAIPVYEIYKCGQEVGWIQGLDLLGEISLEAAIVPHWNNNSGNQYDTRYCFMGAPRLAILEAQLPPGLMVIGIDEYTGLTLDGISGQVDVFGPGQVTIHRGGRQSTLSKGQQFSLADAVHEAAPIVSPILEVIEPAQAEGQQRGNGDIIRHQDLVRVTIAAGDLQGAVDNLAALILIANAGLEQSVYNRAEMALQALQSVAPMLAEIPLDARPDVSDQQALVELILKTRDELRKAKLWTIADTLRDGLIALGYSLSDTTDGTNWQRG